MNEIDLLAGRLRWLADQVEAWSGQQHSDNHYALGCTLARIIKQGGQIGVAIRLDGLVASTLEWSRRDDWRPWTEDERLSAATTLRAWAKSVETQGAELRESVS